jgi:hypothetical protein
MAWMRSPSFISRENIYTKENTYNIDLIRFNRTTRQLEMAVKYALASAAPKSVYSFRGTLEMVAGDFDGDGQDELAASMVWAYNRNLPGSCTGHEIHFMTRIFDIDKTDRYILKQYSIDAGGGHTESEVNNDAAVETISITLAAGDVNGDGKDELVRTWPRGFEDSYHSCCLCYIEEADRFLRKTEVIALPTNSDPKLNRWTVTDNVVDSHTKIKIVDWGETAHSYFDRLAVGDVDRDGVSEIVMQAGTTLYAYKMKVNPDQTLSFSEIARKVSDGWRHLQHLVAGDFTGGGLRVGPPSYRVQQKMASPEVFLNMPPVHRDIVSRPTGNEEVVIQSGSQAIHTSSTSSTNKSTSESKRDWSLSVGMETSAGAAGHTLSASLDNTYGENFTKATTTIASIEFSATTTADKYDQVIYNSTNYGIWEYPVYGIPTSGDEPYTIVVAFPLLNTTTRPQTQQGRFCDENFYAPSHQTYNVWSYYPTGELWFKDYRTLIDSTTTTGGTAASVYMSSVTETLRSDSFKNQVSAGLEYKYENELEIPLIGKAWDVSFRAYAKGSFGMENISTLTTKYDSSSKVEITFPSTSDPSIYTVNPFLYWSKAGYLVVDYQTEPTANGKWSYYTKSDPAFILPWYGFPNLAGEFPPVGHVDHPPCGLEKQLFTHDITLKPAYIQNGELLSMAATVRNFSNVTPPQDVLVRFYLGLPGSANQIGSCTIPKNSLQRSLGLQQCSTTWTVTGGLGEEMIYAVIDPDRAFDEMHDENDAINNNTGYALLNVAKADYHDPGLRQEQAYQAIVHQDAPGLGYGLYLPNTNSTTTVRYELVPARSSLRRVGSLIQFLAYRGGEKDPSTMLFGPVPAVLIASYRDQDLLPGMAEANLKLYRQEGSQWVEAVCPGYEVVRFPTDNQIAVPVCSTGTFLLSDTSPGGGKIYLPLIRR